MLLLSSFGAAVFVFVVCAILVYLFDSKGKRGERSWCFFLPRELDSLDYMTQPMRYGSATLLTTQTEPSWSIANSLLSGHSAMMKV